MVRSLNARAALQIGLFASVVLLASAGLGQDRDPAAAQALFDQARELVAQGKYAEACPKFAESNRLDPAMGTQFQLASCYEKSGRVASAWAGFLEVASRARSAGQLDREKVATERAEKLQSRLPRFVINVPETSKASGLEIRRNGMLVGAAQWGTPVAVDPGEIELTASAPGKQALRQTLRAEEGKTASYSLPALVQGESTPPGSVAATPAAPTLAAPTSAAAQPAPAAPPPSEQPAAKSGNGPWILTLAGVGVVGLGLGGAYALMAKSKYDDSKQECDLDDANSCSPNGIQQRNDARAKGNIATVSVIVGGAALAGAGVLWLASGSSDSKHTASGTRLRAAPALGPNLAALFVQGRF